MNRREPFELQIQKAQWVVFFSLVDDSVSTYKATIQLLAQYTFEQKYTCPGQTGARGGAGQPDRLLSENQFKTETSLNKNVKITQRAFLIYTPGVTLYTYSGTFHAIDKTHCNVVE